MSALNNIDEGIVPSPDHINHVIQLAQRAFDEGEFPVGAIVCQGNRIIGTGNNQKERRKDPTAHAEIIALRHACESIGDWRLTHCQLITTLEPCPMCLGAALQARIASIVFLANDIRWGACGSIMDFSNHPHINHHCQTQYYPNDTVVDLMRSFFHRIGKR